MDEDNDYILRRLYEDKVEKMKFNPVNLNKTSPYFVDNHTNQNKDTETEYNDKNTTKQSFIPTINNNRIHRYEIMDVRDS